MGHHIGERQSRWGLVACGMHLGCGVPPHAAASSQLWTQPVVNTVRRHGIRVARPRVPENLFKLFDSGGLGGLLPPENLLGEPPLLVGSSEAGDHSDSYKSANLDIHFTGTLRPRWLVWCLRPCIRPPGELVSRRKNLAPARRASSLSPTVRLKSLPGPWRS